MKIGHINKQTPLGSINRLVVLKDNSLAIDLNNVWKNYFKVNNYFNFQERANHKLPSSLSGFLKISNNPIEELLETINVYEKLIKNGTQTNIPLTYNVEPKELACPLDEINSYRDFFVHEKHVKKGFEKRQEPVPSEWYEMPVFYKGNRRSFCGNFDEILWPSYTNKLDYELELGIVIGKDGKNIKEKNAMKHVFGLTILNDISARDIQKKEMKVRLGPSKGKDFCSIIGPVITTMDEFNYEEPNLNMKAFINDKLWSEGQSGDAQFSIHQMIEFASKEEWLLATDLFGSGTVGTGCGLELDRWIQPEDIIRLEIENIGSLINTVGKKHTQE